MTIDQKLGKLRQKMREHQIHAIIVPSSDSHQSEYVADHWKSREWISGFTGSAGTAVITLDHAGLWTDSRYYIQAEEELAKSEFELHKVINYSPDFIKYLADTLKSGNRVACDGRVFAHSEIESYKKQLGLKNIEVEVELDLVGLIWDARPSLPVSPVFEHELKYAGKSVNEKLKELWAQILDKEADAYLLTALDDIAWLFNLRGRDIEYNPVFYAFALIEEKKATLFIDLEKTNETLSAKLRKAGVELSPYDAIYGYLKSMGSSTKLYLSSGGVNHLLYTMIPCERIDGEDMVAAMKAIKNDVEIKHTRRAMEKDAVALTRLFMWLERILEDKTVSEYDLAEKLAGFRAEQEGYYGESFGAIVGYAANGAIVHYSPKKDSSAEIKKEGILLLDSGGQYVDGTTDITRTVALGPATPKQKKHFTLVLKGHIALDRLEFPVGVNGYQLDAFARQYLWQHGINYFHGTGHGVGFFLNVHEGPHGISFVYSGRSNKALENGMVTSNEPGVYIEGEYGIRIENLILCRETKQTEFGNFLGHETLTLFPIDHNLIDTSMLSKNDLVWIDTYHKMVYDRVSAYLNSHEKDWLKEKCRPIERN